GEAIRKAKKMLGYQKLDSKKHNKPELSKEQTREKLQTSHNQIKLSREQFLTNMYQYFKNAVSNSKPARTYIESRRLDYRKIEVGYNAGQFHHGTRRDEQLISQCVEYGLLIDKRLTSRTGNQAYSVFGKW